MPRKEAPCSNRFMCCSQRNGTPLATRIVSNRPSPYRKERSKTETVASASGANLPLRKTIIGSSTSFKSFNKTARLGQRFQIFRLGVRIGNNPSSHLEIRATAFVQHRPNDN